MADKKDQYAIRPGQITDLEAIERVDESRFTGAMDAVVSESEAMRLRYMQRHQGRESMVTTLDILLVLAGAAGFGWFFLVRFDMGSGVACMLPALMLPLLLHGWKEAPIKHYRRDYKTLFMPKMAAALGGFKFYPDTGIPHDAVSKTGVLPAHDVYKAEDCFRGLYKGVKVIFSEARLYKRRESQPVFQGIFVILETPHKIFEGHTIITADRKMAERNAAKRWEKLAPVKIQVNDPGHDRFLVFSDKPEDAALLVGQKLLKELSEASDIFHKSLITAVLFRGQYVFMMIPCRSDMFEASDVYVPVSTKRQAMNCKREMERILEIIDVFDIYAADKSAV